MPRFRSKFLIVLFCAGSFFLGADEPAPDAGKNPAPSHYFQDSGSQVDSLVDRIRFKIAYSWMKSGEYLSLAFSSVPDSVPAKQRDVQARLEIKKEELTAQGREAVRNAAGQAKDAISQTGSELRSDLEKAGSEIADGAREEIRQNADKLFK